MKALRIPTALSLLLLTAVAPSALAVGDSNLDTGVGSAASRGPYGFNANYEPLYITQPNDYGVWRDAYGGLRDSGMVPDNLTTRVPEPTWEQTHIQKPPIPMGAPGGLGGGGLAIGGLGAIGGAGAIGGLGGFGGLGLGGLGVTGGGFGGIGSAVGAANLGGSVFGLRGMGNALSFPFLGAGSGYSLGITGSGPYAQSLRGPLGYAGMPGTFFPYPTYNTPQYLGPGGGAVPYQQTTVRNITQPGGQITNQYTVTTNGIQSFFQSSQGRPSPGTAVTQNTFEQQGNQFSTTTTGPSNSPFNPLVGPPNLGTLISNGGTGSGGTGTNSFPTNFTQQSFFSSNSYRNPNVPNGYNTMSNLPNVGSFGGLGSGFASPQTAGDQRSAFYAQNPVAGGLLGSGYGTAGTSGSPRSVFYQNNLGTGSLGGSFATPQTAGSERSNEFANLNNTFGGSFGGFGFPGYGGLGGYGSVGAAMAPWGGSPDGTMPGPEDKFHSDGSIARASGANTFASGSALPQTGGPSLSVTGALLNRPTNASLEVPNGANRTSTFYNGGATSFSGTNSGGTAGAYGPVAVLPQQVPPLAVAGGQLGSVPSGAMAGATAAASAGAGGLSAATAGTRPGRRQYRAERVIASKATTHRASKGGAADPPAETIVAVPPELARGAYDSGIRDRRFMPSTATPIGYYAVGQYERVRLANQPVAVAPFGPQGNLTTDLEPKLAALHLTPEEAIGRVIGSIRYDSGDIVTYGSKGTLRLAPDNSGSITFNSGEILTFAKASPALRWMALRSSLLF